MLYWQWQSQLLQPRLETVMLNRGLRSVLILPRYRGGAGQWAWVLHRVSGLGVLLFLMLHILDTSTVFFASTAYEFFVRLYKNPIFGLAEIALGGALLFHALNGVRVSVMDFWPHLWRRHAEAQRLMWILFTVIFVPAAGIMLVRIIRYAFAQMPH